MLEFKIFTRLNESFLFLFRSVEVDTNNLKTISMHSIWNCIDIYQAFYFFIFFHFVRNCANDAVNKEGMSRLPKRMQSKRVAPPAVPEIYRHSGSSFGSAGYGSCDDTSNMGGGSNFYATASDPNNSLNVSLRSNASNSSSIDLPDNASRAASVAGKYWIVFCILQFYVKNSKKKHDRKNHFDVSRIGFFQKNSHPNVLISPKCVKWLTTKTGLYFDMFILPFE